MVKRDYYVLEAEVARLMGEDSGLKEYGNINLQARPRNA
jgi:hypothetical protein